MKLDHPELTDRLAGRYVLGVMRGSARRRFESLMRYRPALRTEVAGWENRLSGLHEAGAPVPPPEHLRAAVLASITRTRVRSASSNARSPLLAWWAGLATVFSVLLVALVVFGPRFGFDPAQRGVPVSQEPPPMQVAVLADAEARGQFLVCSDPGSRRSVVEVIGKPEVPPDRDGELWLVAGDEPPRSLGLMPASGRGYFEVPDALAKALDGGTLAVSIEPKGGSPSGLPTGAIPYTGRVIGMWMNKDATVSGLSDPARLRALAQTLRPGSR
ncbi:MAG: anti-sigma factor [Gammaproteobacteria bacterium]